jgi:hypothetical protein
MVVTGLFYTPGPANIRQLRRPLLKKKTDVCMGKSARLTIVLLAIFFVTQLPDSGPG